MDSVGKSTEETSQVPTKRKQVDISQFFSGQTKKKAPTTSVSTPDKEVKKPETRKLFALTAEKWKSTSLAKYNANEWLIINADNTGSVNSMKCVTCEKFRDRIIGIKAFAPQWCDKGSRRLQHGAALEHAMSEPHKRSFDLYMKSKGLSLTDRDKAIFQSASSRESVLTGLASMKRADIELTKKKFETAYFVAKEELPLVKYKRLLSLEEKHGVNLGHSYRNENT